MKKEEVTEEEINKYMDFDRLIVSYDQIQRKAKMKFPKVVAVIGIIAAISGSIVYFSLDRHLTQPLEIKLPTVLSEQAKTPDKKETGKKAVEVKPALPTTSTSTKERVTSKEKLTLTQEYIGAEPELGYPHLYSYFEEQLKYPKAAVKDSLQGIVTASFVINIIGKPEQIEISNSLGKPFDDEVNRLIKDMPIWKPARLNGKAVTSKISLPFTFSFTKKSN